MLDKIIINNLEIVAKHGVNPEEKINAQPFVFTVEMYTSVQKAGENDDLNLTINYAKAKKTIVKFVTENCFDLIETLAVRTAELLLKEIDILEKVKVLVKKPQAPMSGKFDYVGVEVERQWNEVYLSLGSNLGDKEGYLDFAIDSLKSNDNFKDVVESKRITTEPYGGVADNQFLNSAVKVKTILGVQDLLAEIHKIELNANRKRDIHWGNRTLDIDIIFYNDIVYKEGDLCIPHIDMQNRDFVLKPLMELCPYKMHMGINKSVYTMYNDLVNKN